jgi:uncharacterized protein YndB with AHSA1/START domain
MTAMTDTTTQVYQVFIAASPQAIWDAITKPEFTVRYFHGSAVDTELEVGGRFHFLNPDRTGLWGDGVVLESDPPRRLAITWHALWDDEISAEQPSRVIWEIEPRDEGPCLVTVTHDRLEGAPKTAEMVSGAGWMFVLSGLKTLLETGEAMA